VILRSDGTPVYNLAVVSDDADTRITHVIRGDDHLSNTPKQVLLYRALGRPEPAFGHVPLILGPDGKRLSKRHGATALREYEAQGVLPEAMVNFLALLGWSPGDDREVMTLAELIAAFDPSRILKKSAVFDVDKLSWLNGKHLAAKPASELTALLRSRLEDLGPAATARLTDEAWTERLIDLLKHRVRSVEDLAEQARPFVADDVRFEPEAVDKHWLKEPQEAAERLERVATALASAEWTHDGLERAIRDLAGEMGVGAGKLIHPLRVALTGNMASPGIFDVLVLLGRDRSSQRVREGVQGIRAR
jgi:glutamyl-tRNA synthetase